MQCRPDPPEGDAGDPDDQRRGRCLAAGAGGGSDGAPEAAGGWAIADRGSRRSGRRRIRKSGASINADELLLAIANEGSARATATSTEPRRRSMHQSRFHRSWTNSKAGHRPRRNNSSSSVSDDRRRRPPLVPGAAKGSTALRYHRAGQSSAFQRQAISLYSHCWRSRRRQLKREPPAPPICRVEAQERC